MKKKIVALIGRPNVGKSTLFNRLSIRSKAIVHDLPGVTRDRKYAEAKLGPLEFTIIDTPGLDEAKTDQLEYRMMQQTVSAINEADLICFMLDGKVQVTPPDQWFARLIRKYSVPCILVINKCEKQLGFDSEYYKLGYENPVFISAEHAIGLMDLYEEIQQKLSSATHNPTSDSKRADFIQIAISGRPNVGKSTFINALVGTERMLVGPEAGITRESVAIDYEHEGQRLRLIDTAGLRRRSVIEQDLEKLSVSDTIHSINYASIVILIIDAQTPFEQQDLKVASYIIDQGRGLVIAVNKCDLIKDKLQFEEELHYKVNKYLSQVKGVPVVLMSAISKHNISLVLEQCIKTYHAWNTKLSTSMLNQWLQNSILNHPLPLASNGRRLKLKYITQTKTRPPTFKLFSNYPDQVSEDYKKYLINDLRKKCPLLGVPIRLIFTQTKNPYT